MAVAFRFGDGDDAPDLIFTRDIFTNKRLANLADRNPRPTFDVDGKCMTWIPVHLSSYESYIGADPYFVSS